MTNYFRCMWRIKTILSVSDQIWEEGLRCFHGAILIRHIRRLFREESSHGTVCFESERMIYERCMGRNCFVLYKSYISSHETVCFESERNLRWSFLTVTWTIFDSLYMNNCTRQMGRFIHVLWDDKRPSYVPILVRCISGFESSHKTLRFEYVRVTNDLPMDR